MLNQEGTNNYTRPYRDREPYALHGLQKSKGPKAVVQFHPQAEKTMRSRPDWRNKDKRCVCAERAQQLSNKVGILFLIPPNAEVVLDGRAVGQSFMALTYQKTLGECSSLCKCNSFVLRTVRLQVTSVKHQNPSPAGGGCCSTRKRQRTPFSPVLLPWQAQAGTACGFRHKVLQLQLSLLPWCKSDGCSVQEGNTA